MTATQRLEAYYRRYTIWPQPYRSLGNRGRPCWRLYVCILERISGEGWTVYPRRTSFRSERAALRATGWVALGWLDQEVGTR